MTERNEKLNIIESSHIHTQSNETAVDKEEKREVNLKTHTQTHFF